MTAAKEAAKPVTDLIVEFEFDRDTKNTRRYAEVENGNGNGVVIGTLYLRKEAVATLGDPESLTVTIAAG